MSTPARNDITKDLIKTKVSNEQYRQGWDRIFSKQTPETASHVSELAEKPPEKKEEGD
tara:strand:+ start:420 stop:593 length:174 start_codon:yes stop_codon:yes gene_type:complete